MFKKSLIAMAIAGASLSAVAGSISVDVLEGTATDAGTAINADLAVYNAAFDGCQQIADELGVDLDPGAGPFVHDAAAVNDTATLTGADGVYNTTTSVTLTGTDACTVVFADQLVPASSAKYSAEGAQKNGVTVSAKLIAGVGGISAEDTIIVTVDGGTIDEDATLTAASKITASTADDFELLGIVNGNQALYFVATNESEDPRGIMDLSGLVVEPANGVTNVSISAAVQNTSNVQYDQYANTQVINIANQYSSTLEVLLDGIIDVATERFDLETNTDDNLNGYGTFAGSEAALTDTAVLKVTKVSSLGDLTPAEISIVASGDFSWMMDLDANDDGDLSSAELLAGVTYDSHTDNSLAGDGNDAAATAALNDDMDELTLTVTVGGGAVDAFHSVAFVVPGVAGDATVSLNETTFMADVTALDADETEMVVANNANIGAWTLNGSVVEVPYLPFGPATQPILRHTNTGVQTGDIAVRYMVEGEHTSWQSLGVLVEDATPGVRNLLSQVTGALKDAGYDAATTGFKVALEVTTNVPGGDVTVYAAAKITTSDSDRLTVGAFQ